MPTYTFTEADFKAANDAWGCNCGPSALAFALQIGLEQVRAALPAFEARGYVNPTMMREALATLGRRIEIVRNPSGGRNRGYGIDTMFAGPMSLVRIQWTGPWTSPSNNSSRVAKWAAGQTHWIACWNEGARMVFDCNSGMTTFEWWESNVVNAITKTIPRADGGWFPTNVWRLKQQAANKDGSDG